MPKRLRKIKLTGDNKTNKLDVFENEMKIDSLYDDDLDTEFSDEFGNFDYFGKAEAEDNSCPY